MDLSELRHWVEGVLPETQPGILREARELLAAYQGFDSAPVKALARLASGARSKSLNLTDFSARMLGSLSAHESVAEEIRTLAQEGRIGGVFCLSKTCSPQLIEHVLRASLEARSKQVREEAVERAVSVCDASFAHYLEEASRREGDEFALRMLLAADQLRRGFSVQLEEDGGAEVTVREENGTCTQFLDAEDLVGPWIRTALQELAPDRTFDLEGAAARSSIPSREKAKKAKAKKAKAKKAKAKKAKAKKAKAKKAKRGS